jgi:translation initiation factor IF-3
VRLHPKPIDWEIQAQTVTVIDRNGNRRERQQLNRVIRSLQRGNDAEEELLVEVQAASAESREPVCKIYTKNELRKGLRTQDQTERVAKRKASAEKAIELNWSIRENDVKWSLKRIKEWLEDGKRVSVSLKRKKRTPMSNLKICLALVDTVRETATSVPGTSEVNVEGSPASAMILEFQPKEKNYKDKDLSIPWDVNPLALKVQLQVLQGALKKGKTVEVELTDPEDEEKKAKFTREELLEKVRSACRVTKDALEVHATGDVNSTITLEMAGLVKGRRRELEIPVGLKDSDLETRVKWIDEWVAKEKEVKVFLGKAEEDQGEIYSWEKFHNALREVGRKHPLTTIEIGEESAPIILKPGSPRNDLPVLRMRQAAQQPG